MSITSRCGTILQNSLMAGRQSFPLLQDVNDQMGKCYDPRFSASFKREWVLDAAEIPFAAIVRHLQEDIVTHPCEVRPPRMAACICAHP